MLFDKKEMNNQEEINTLMKDFIANKQYFDDIDEAKHINQKVEISLENYKEAVQKVMTMVNVTKLLDLDIKCEGGYRSDNNVVLSNKGLRSRYISNNYVTQSNGLSVREFARIFAESIKIIFNHPDISMVQKNKIMPLKTLDVSFLAEIATNEKVVVRNVTRLETNMSISTESVNIPHFSTEHNYSTLKNISLLSIRGQVQGHLNSFLTERRSMLVKIAEKRKELHKLVPVVFLFSSSTV